MVLKEAIERSGLNPPFTIEYRVSVPRGEDGVALYDVEFIKWDGETLMSESGEYSLDDEITSFETVQDVFSGTAWLSVDYVEDADVMDFSDFEIGEVCSMADDGMEFIIEDGQIVDCRMGE